MADRRRHPSPRSHPLTRAIYRRIDQQLIQMADELGRPSRSRPFGEILGLARRFLAQIASHLSHGRIVPRAPLRVSRRQPVPVPSQRVVRVGVYPVNGNPLHWGHLLCALGAIAELQLDQVVFLVQGIDSRKLEASRATQVDRHRMARQVLAHLHPLVSYSNVGLGNSRIGEENLFHLLRMNATQPMIAFYMVGTDHYRLVDRHGNPDTLPRLQANMVDPSFVHDPQLHEVRALFMKRGEPGPAVPTSIGVEFLPEVLGTSSTAVRQGELSYAPFEVVRYIRAHRVYASTFGETPPLRSSADRPGIWVRRSAASATRAKARRAAEPPPPPTFAARPAADTSAHA